MLTRERLKELLTDRNGKEWKKTYEEISNNYLYWLKGACGESDEKAQQSLRNMTDLCMEASVGTFSDEDLEMLDEEDFLEEKPNE